MDIKYKNDDIVQVLNLLNSIEVKGLDNCRRLLIIEQVLQNPVREEKKDGTQ